MFAFFVVVCNSRAKLHMCWTKNDDCDAVVDDGDVIIVYLFYFIELYFSFYFSVG